MITLIIICIIWFIKSYYNLNKIAKDTNEDFNLFTGGIINYLGFLFGLFVIIVTSTIMVLIYLP